MLLLKDLDKKEYSEYYTPYLSLLDGESSIESVLVDAIEQTVRLVNSIDKPLSYKYAEGKWSIGQVLQHNLDTERISRKRNCYLLSSQLDRQPLICLRMLQKILCSLEESQVARS
jgi:hypothetical protein